MHAQHDLGDDAHRNGAGATVRVHAPAKLNLTLAVGAPYPAGHVKAGFHPIASWFVTIDLADSLEVTALENGAPSSFQIAWAEDAPQASPIDWPLEKDLIYRAHASAEQAGGRKLPVRAVLHKRVPVGGGCGGGSSDAAAMLIALARLFPGVLPTAEWVKIGAALGSDVTFFLDEHRLEAHRGEENTDRMPRPAIVWGVGEHLERVEPCTLQVWLIVPSFGCHTGKVYGAFDRRLEIAASEVAALEQRVRAGVARAFARGRMVDDDLFNDLAAPACEVEPRLGELIARVNSAGFRAHVTGSGSTLFVLRTGRVDEEAGLRAACGGWVVVLACTVL